MMSASMRAPQHASTQTPLSAGSATLHRFTLLPRGQAVARLAIVHGYGEHSARYEEFMRWMIGRGVACYAFDFRGHGRSPGRRGHVRQWGEYVDDLRAFLGQEALCRNDGVPLFVLGHSHGALVVIAAALDGAPEFQGVAGVVLTNPYLRNGVPVPLYRWAVARALDLFLPWARFSSRVRVEWLTSDPRMQQATADDPLCHRSATPRWFLSMTRAQEHVMERAHAFRLPMLMLIGSHDQVARPETGRQFFERASSADKSLKTYPEMVHELLRERQRERVYEDVLEWISVRLPGRGSCPSPSPA